MLYRYVIWQRGFGLSPKRSADVIKYFPQQIPRDAGNPRFWYWSPPGDVDMQLRCILPSAQVVQLKSKIAPIARITGGGSEENFYNQVGDRFPDVAYPHFRDATNSYYERSSGSFTIYIIDDGNDQTDDDMVSYQYGVAIDEKANEVIYFMNTHAEGPQPSPTSRRSTSE